MMFLSSEYSDVSGVLTGPEQQPAHTLDVHFHDPPDVLKQLRKFKRISSGRQANTNVTNSCNLVTRQTQGRK